jgi:hypothetical protein
VVADMEIDPRKNQSEQTGIVSRTVTLSPRYQRREESPTVMRRGIPGDSERSLRGDVVRGFPRGNDLIAVYQMMSNLFSNPILFGPENWANGV